MGLTQSVAPTQEPVSLEDVKANARITEIDEDLIVERMYIPSARHLAEARTGRQLVTAQWALTLDAFPWRIELPRPPAASVESVKYIDADGALQTLAVSDYTVIIDGVFGFVCPAFGKSWPSTRSVPNAVTVAYTSGYGAPTAVPVALRLAVAKLAATMFEQRETFTEARVSQLPDVDRIFNSYKAVEFF